MKQINQAKHTEQKSKFFAYLFELDTFDELDQAIQEIKDEHPKARHICIGCLFQKEEIKKNDSEVGNPGKRLLELLKQKNLTSHALIVARYFGGIKLGPAGVGKAFQQAAKSCLE